MNDKPHKNLVAWQRSMKLVVGIYEITKRFPKEEIYGHNSGEQRFLFLPISQKVPLIGQRSNFLASCPTRSDH